MLNSHHIELRRKLQKLLKDKPSHVGTVLTKLTVGEAMCLLGEHDYMTGMVEGMKEMGQFLTSKGVQKCSATQRKK